MAGAGEPPVADSKNSSSRQFILLAREGYYPSGARRLMKNITCSLAPRLVVEVFAAVFEDVVMGVKEFIAGFFQVDFDGLDFFVGF